MKKWLIVSVLVLSGCNVIYGETPQEENQTSSSIPISQHHQEIEQLLIKVELEAGLGNFMQAESYFTQLEELIEEYDITDDQRGRINSMALLLKDTYADTDFKNDTTERIFSGSDAAAKVMNKIGNLPTGYVLVYHEIPSFVGSDDIGYYVFMVPEVHEQIDETVIRETFFVTNRGEIYVFE